MSVLLYSRRHQSHLTVPCVRGMGRVGRTSPNPRTKVEKENVVGRLHTHGGNGPSTTPLSKQTVCRVRNRKVHGSEDRPPTIVFTFGTSLRFQTTGVRGLG